MKAAFLLLCCRCDLRNWDRATLAPNLLLARRRRAGRPLMWWPESNQFSHLELWRWKNHMGAVGLSPPSLSVRCVVKLLREILQNIHRHKNLIRCIYFKPSPQRWDWSTRLLMTHIYLVAVVVWGTNLWASSWMKMQFSRAQSMRLTARW